MDGASIIFFGKCVNNYIYNKLVQKTNRSLIFRIINKCREYDLNM